MNLVLLRHADAEPKTTTDFERQLTARGRQQARNAGRFLAACEARPDRIITSPLKRAVQTAEILHEEVHARNGMEPDGRLGCGMTPETAFALLWECDQDAGVVLVGHEPDFSNLAAALIGMESAYGFEMKKAACAFFELEKPARGGATLRALTPPWTQPGE